METAHEYSDSVQGRASLVHRYALWWPLTIGPLGDLLVYLAFHYGWDWLLNKENNETAAIIILPVSLVVALFHASVARNPLHLWLAGFSLVAFLRELHFQGTDDGVWVALLVLLVWAGLWWRRLVGPLHEGRMLPLLVGTFSVYALSLAISRRMFRDIPGLTFEPELHIPLEEVLENVAHLMLFVTVCAGSWRPIVKSSER